MTQPPARPAAPAGRRCRSRRPASPLAAGRRCHRRRAAGQLGSRRGSIRCAGHRVRPGAARGRRRSPSGPGDRLADRRHRLDPGLAAGALLRLAGARGRAGAAGWPARSRCSACCRRRRGRRWAWSRCGRSGAPGRTGRVRFTGRGAGHRGHLVRRPLARESRCWRWSLALAAAGRPDGARVTGADPAPRSCGVRRHPVHLVAAEMSHRWRAGPPF